MLWTDIIDPATLTGYARAALADYEARKGTLARWLPNREVSDIVVRFMKGQTGLIDVAKFRAFDAEPEIGERQSKQRVTIELPAIGQLRPVTEYEQLRARGGSISDEEALVTIQNETVSAVRAISDASERMRGIVLSTGKATIDQDNYKTDDDFGRPGSHDVAASVLWDAGTTEDPLSDLVAWSDVYEDTTGEMPGSILMPRRVFRALQDAPQVRTTLIGGAERRATDDQVRELVSSAGLPDILIYDRRVSVAGAATRVIPDNALYLLPEPVETDDWMGTDLGGTFWGRTLSSTVPGWDIEPAEQPGIVAGVFQNEKPPHGLEVVADAIALPVLANAERSLKATVLA